VPLARDWQVLLIGGASGTGKTAVASEVARAFDISVAQVDGYRLMLERVTSAECFPALHGYTRSAPSDAGQPTLDGDELCARWIDVAHEVSRALEIVLAFHAATEAAVVLEGDTLLPRLASSRMLAGVPVFNRVRAVFLHEPDEARLRARLEHRGRGYQLLSPEAQARELTRNMAYGRWLAEQATAEHCPVIVPSHGDHVGGNIAATAARVVAQLSDERSRRTTRNIALMQ